MAAKMSETGPAWRDLQGVELGGARDSFDAEPIAAAPSIAETEEIPPSPSGAGPAVTSLGMGSSSRPIGSRGENPGSATSPWSASSGSGITPRS